MTVSKQEMLGVINEFFGDTSRAREQTREGLEEAASAIESYLDVLEDN